MEADEGVEGQETAGLMRESGNRREGREGQVDRTKGKGVIAGSMGKGGKV